jgi:hypothetical protein
MGSRGSAHLGRAREAPWVRARRPRRREPQGLGPFRGGVRASPRAFAPPTREPRLGPLEGPGANAPPSRIRDRTRHPRAWLRGRVVVDRAGTGRGSAGGARLLVAAPRASARARARCEGGVPAPPGASRKSSDCERDVRRRAFGLRCNDVQRPLPHYPGGRPRPPSERSLRVRPREPFPHRHRGLSDGPAPATPAATLLRSPPVPGGTDGRVPAAVRRVDPAVLCRGIDGRAIGRAPRAGLRRKYLRRPGGPCVGASLADGIHLASAQDRVVEPSR